MDTRAGRKRHIIRRMCDQGDAVTAWETGADTDTDPEALAAIAEAERIFREALVRRCPIQDRRRAWPGQAGPLGRPGEGSR